MMEGLYRLVWLVYFKVCKLSFFKTPFQSEKNILGNLWTSSVSQLQKTEWNLKEEYSITLTEFLKVKLSKLGEAGEDADEVVLPV